MKGKDIKKRKVTLKAYDILSPRQEKENKYIRTVYLACTFHHLVGRKQAKQSPNTQPIILVDQNTLVRVEAQRASERL